MPVSPAFRPSLAHAALGGDFYDAVAPADFPKHILRYRNQRWAERGRPRQPDRRRVARPFRPLRAAARQLRRAAGAALSRPPVPHLQSRSRRRPRLPLRAAARPRGRPPARPRHQGQRPHALVAHRRRPADAEGRRARGARHRDARGARRRHLEILQPDRDRRGTDARRRALADALLGAGAAQPLAYPHRQLPAPALPRRARATSRKLLDHSIRTYIPDLWRDDAGERAPSLPRRGLPPRRAHRRAAGCSPASSTACSTPTTSTSPARASTTARGASCRCSIPAFTAAYFDQTGLYAFGRQPDTLLWNLTRLAECLLPLADRTKLEAVLHGFEPHFHRAFNAAMLRRLGLAVGRRGRRRPRSSARSGHS